MSIILKTQPDISVVIPVYNVAPYIKECATSLFNQTLQNIEYIFIDDASSDDSVKILKEEISKYPLRHKNIRLITHDENKGISYTRQEGVLLAKGKWIIHCDGDDIVPIDSYQTLLSRAQEAGVDMIIGAFRIFGESQTSFDVFQGEGLIPSFKLMESIGGSRKPQIIGTLWNKLIKRELIKDINFPEEVSYCEDVTWLFYFLNKNADIKILILPYISYYYRMRKGSLIKLKGEKRNADIIKLINVFENLGKNSNEIVRNAINAKIIGFIYVLVKNNRKYDIIEGYKTYKEKIPVNVSLNIFEKIHLYSAIKGYKSLSLLIGMCNFVGRKVIKKILSFVPVKKK